MFLHMSEHPKVKNFCFTWNYQSEEPDVEMWILNELVETNQIRYAAFSMETAPTTGQRHLQGFLGFYDSQRLSAVKKILPSPHFEEMKGSLMQNQAYCSKENDLIVYGNLPDLPGASKTQKKSAEERWQLAKDGQFEMLNPEQIRTYEYIFSKYGQQPKDLAQLNNVWIQGPTGLGKSHGTRLMHPGLYSKPASNKWWDGYKGEEVVLLDDLDPQHGKEMEAYIKIWSDHYVFTAEVKGGHLQARPGKIIITSNYTIDEVFPKLAADGNDPIKRRFTVINLFDPTELAEWKKGYEKAKLPTLIDLTQ